MNIISGIGESGFLAHSAFSAGIATKDSNGNDITATYLTGVDLTPYQTTADMVNYQTTAGMTAYLTTGDSAEFMTTAERSDYIPTGVSSEFYTTANTANYISEVPDTYLQNTDLSTEDGKVTAISGIPLSAGGDVPEGVMVESGLEYNAVNEISGYNGSAIAQYGAEKQWLVHDDTLVHAANSAQYALGVNLSAVAQLLGVDETVLYDASGVASGGSIFNLSDNFYNYKIVKVYAARGANLRAAKCTEFQITDSASKGFYVENNFGATGTLYCDCFAGTFSGDKIKIDWDLRRTIGTNSYTTAPGAAPLSITKVIGIGRRS